MAINFKGLKIKSQILIVFLIFTVVTVLLLWVFQISLLSNFYKAIKKLEIEQTALEIEENLNSSDLDQILYSIVVEKNIDIMISTENGKKQYIVTAYYTNFFTGLTTDQTAQIYSNAVENGGKLITWTESNNALNTYSEYEELIYIKIADDENQSMITLNTTVTPVTSTVETLKIQLFCLTILMLLLSTILAVFIANKISKPIANINEKAKILASGDYTVKFLDKGSRETKELSQILNYTAVELSKIESLRRELIANVSHDLRTPLTMISAYAEVMRDIPNENNSENAQIIIDESIRLKNLVNDLIDISKIESGKDELSFENVNITESIKTILHRYDKLVEYNFDFYHGKDIYVYADELRISQVIYNLVNNAINYTGDDNRVILTQTVLNGMVKIEVTDTGEGIEEDKITTIWDRYYKGEKSHKMAQVGTGLGLSIVKNIVVSHGGECGVKSKPGEGCTFWFVLPIIE